MSKSEANSVVDEIESSFLNSSNEGNDISSPSSSTLKVSSDEKISPKKRSKSPEEVTFSNKAKGKHLRNSKRKKGEISKNFLEEESTKNKKSHISKVEKEELCQTSHTSSALSMSKSDKNTKQKMESVPNVDDNNTACSSANDNYLPTLNDNNNSGLGVADKLRSKKRKKSLPKWSAKKNLQIDETIKSENDSHHTVDNLQKSYQENLEDELICSICSEIFISAVTLNCSHSFCKYCIMQWRKDHSTCPICRQNISSQNSTLVLDKCVDRLMETSKEEIKNHRKEIIEYREKNKEPDTQPITVPDNTLVPINFDDDNGWVDLDYQSSGDEDDFYDYDYSDDASDYYDQDEYYDEEGEYEEDGDFEHDENGVEQGDNVEQEGQEEEEDYVEEGEYEEDEYEDTAGEDYESEEEDEENESDEDGSYEVSDNDDDYESDAYENDSKCFNCGIKGHLARKCPTRVAYTGIAGAYYGGYGSCFRCKEEGHWANGCPN